MRPLLLLGRGFWAVGLGEKAEECWNWVEDGRCFNLKIKTTGTAWHRIVLRQGTKVVIFDQDFEPYPEVRTGKFRGLDSTGSLDSSVVSKRRANKGELCGHIRIQNWTGTCGLTNPRSVLSPSCGAIDTRVGLCRTLAPTSRHADSVGKTRRRDFQAVVIPIHSLTVNNAAALPTGTMGATSDASSHAAWKLFVAAHAGQLGLEEVSLGPTRQSIRNCRRGDRLSQCHHPSHPPAVYNAICYQWELRRDEEKIVHIDHAV